jgi:hypothetical protein
MQGRNFFKKTEKQKLIVVKKHNLVQKKYVGNVDSATRCTFQTENKNKQECYNKTNKNEEQEKRAKTLQKSKQ